MSERVLTRRELNRTLLARQLLLERSRLPLARAIERLAALQAQYTPAPYVALWSRLDGFRREQLTRALERRQVIKATLLRSTLHLVTRGDFPAFASAVLAAERGRVERRGADLERLRKAIPPQSMSSKELRELARQVLSVEDEWTVAFSLRALPLVAVPPSGTWGHHGSSASQLWPEPLPPTEEATALVVRRALRAFGPMTRQDLVHFTNFRFRQLDPALEGMRRDGDLYDLPRAPRAAEDTPAPPRFLPPYDSAYLAYADKSRICPPEYEPLVYRKVNTTMRPCFLVDGFVAGAWKVERTRRRATLLLEPFERLPRAARAELEEEGVRLLRFHEPDADAHPVRWAVSGSRRA